jgi:hypothetical protein
MNSQTNSDLYTEFPPINILPQYPNTAQHYLIRTNIVNKTIVFQVLSYTMNKCDTAATDKLCQFQINISL